MIAPISRITIGRHRGVGGCPSGNRMKINGMNAASTETHVESHTKKVTANREPGCVISAYVTHSSASPPTRKPSPTVMKSQPIGLRGCRATISGAHRHVPEDEEHGDPDEPRVFEAPIQPHQRERDDGDRDREEPQTPSSDARARHAHDGPSDRTGTRPATVVPEPTALVTESEPPTASSRSAMPCSPVP